MGVCFCTGPRPGHKECPCMERQEDRKELDAFQRGYEMGQRQRDRDTHRARSREFPENYPVRRLSDDM